MVSEEYPNEEWRSVPGYEESHEISNYGRVRSLKRDFIDKTGKMQHVKGKILKPKITALGYAQVHLKGVDPWLSVHRLLAKAFIPNPKGLPFVNHKDENKANNVVENLEWCTAKYNCNYGTRVARIVAGRSTPVHQIDIETNEIIATWQNAEEAARVGFGRNRGSNINHCLRGKIPYAYGYKWAYAN